MLKAGPHTKLTFKITSITQARPAQNIHRSVDGLMYQKAASKTAKGEEVTLNFWEVWAGKFKEGQCIEANNPWIKQYREERAYNPPKTASLKLLSKCPF